MAFPIIEEGELFGPAVAYLIAWIAIADSVTVVLLPVGLTGSVNVVSGGKSRSEFRPKANAIAERLVGILRWECLDHVIVVNESHLVRLLREFAAYYNTIVPTEGLDLHPPRRRSLVSTGPIVSSQSLEVSITSTREPRELIPSFALPQRLTSVSYGAPHAAAKSTRPASRRGRSTERTPLALPAGVEPSPVSPWPCQ